MKANRPEKTFGDLLNQREDAGFVGREGELNDFRIIINNPNPPRPLINVYGIGGIGKTALLRQYVRIARGHKIPTGVIDIRVQRGNIFEIIEDLRKQLELESGSDAAFREYAAALKRLYSIETKIERLSTGSKTSNLLNLAAEGIADSTSNVTSTIAGGIAGSVAGPIGTILGAGLGAAGGKRLGGLLTETAITNLIRRGLSADDARFIIGLEDELTTTFANALNEITTAAGRLLLVIDTYEEISPAVDEWFRDDLLTKLRTQIIIIVAGRDSLVTQEPQWYRYSSLISQKEIHRFTTQDAIRYLMIRGVTDQTLANRLIEFTEGLPWALALICDINDERIGIPGTVIDLDIDQHVVGDRVIARFLSQISGTELAIVLNVCAIARRFDRDLLSFVIGEVATAAHVNRLQRYSFVRLLQGGQMALHDIVRNFMSNRLKTLDPTYYRSTHLKLHEYYNTKLAVTGSNLARADVIECIYHAFNADENMGLDVFTEFFSRLDVYRQFDFRDALLTEFIRVDCKVRQNQLWQDYCRAYQAANHGDWDSATRGASLLLESVELPPLVRCFTLDMLGEILIGQGRYREASSRFAESASIKESAQNSNPIPNLGQTLSRLSEVSAILGRFRKAEESAERNQTLSRMAHDVLGEAWALKSFGDIYRLWGKTNDAIDNLEKSRALFERSRDEYGTGVALIQLGRVYTHSGQWRRAEGCLKQAKEIFERLWVEYGKANAILFLGNILRFKYFWRQAETFYLQALELHERMGSRREIGPLLGSLGLVQLYQNRLEESFRNLDASLQMKRAQEYNRGVSVTLILLGEYYFVQRDWAGAAARYTEALQTAEAVRSNYHRVQGRVRLAGTYLEMGRYGEVQSLCAKAARLARRYRYPHELARLNLVLGDLNVREKNWSAAQALYLTSMKHALDYNIFLLDEVLTHFIEIVRTLAGSGKNAEAIQILSGIIDAWRHDDLGILESARSNDEDAEGRDGVIAACEQLLPSL